MRSELPDVTDLFLRQVEDLVALPMLGKAQELNLVDSKVRQVVRQFQEQVAKHVDLRKQAEEDLLQVMLVQLLRIVCV